MLVIAVLTIIAFAFLYNTTDMDRVGSNMVARIYGRDVMQVDVEKAVRNYQLALALGQMELVRDLAGQAQTEDEAVNNFIWNLIVLQHEAAALGVEPGTQAVVDRVKSLPVFQTGGQFDPLKYSAFVQEQLAPRGFTERQLESVVRDALRLEGVRGLVVSPAVVLEAEIAPMLERLAPANVEVVRFSEAQVAKDVTVSDEELERAFADRRESLQSPEKRSVRYVAFVLEGGQEELKDKDRVQALQKIATATGDFAQALGEGGRSLEEVAKESGQTVRTTPLFSPDGATGGALADLDGEVVPAATRVAFRLPSGPGSFEIVQLGEDGYAIIEIAEVQAARPLTFEEARADLGADLIAQKRTQALGEFAGKTISSIREAMVGGRSFSEAAKEAGVEVEERKGLTVFAEDLSPEDRQLALAVADVAAGNLGEFVPQPTGGFAAFVVSRGDSDSAKESLRRPMIVQGATQAKEMLLFAQWLATAREQSGLRVLRPMM
jgi:hypothetical protein